MPRRFVAAIAAVLLAVLGAVILIGYVGGADARARSGEQLVPVLVVAKKVAAGTAPDALAGSVTVQDVPRRLAAPGSIRDLSKVAGLVTGTELLPGEQVLSGRFVDPVAVLPAGTVAVPRGMVEVSLSLERERAVGGVLKAGDKVGVQLTNQQSAAAGLNSYSVFRVFHDVLVTRVAAPAGNGATDPSAAYTVTLAVSPADASVVVLGMTAKQVWLSLEKAAPGLPKGASSTITATVGGIK
jgi:pilus assembly protein CpaB